MTSTANSHLDSVTRCKFYHVGDVFGTDWEDYDCLVEIIIMYNEAAFTLTARFSAAEDHREMLSWYSSDFEVMTVAPCENPFLRVLANDSILVSVMFAILKQVCLGWPMYQFGKCEDQLHEQGARQGLQKFCPQLE